MRAEELTAAAEVLEVDHVQLLAYPDGGLDQVPLEELTRCVTDALAAADLLLVFDENGITGHPDHRRATQAALAAASQAGVPVLAWALPQTVADQLNAEFGTAFGGRRHCDLDIESSRLIARGSGPRSTVTPPSPVTTPCCGVVWTCSVTGNT